MEFIQGILGLAVFLAFGWVLTKMGDGVMKGLNRSVLSMGEHKEGQQARHTFTALTSATVSDIAHNLTNYVAAVDAPLGGTAVLYEKERTDEHVVYVYGGKSALRFAAVMLFGAQDGMTKVEFAVPRWTEEDGLTVDLDVLKRLRKQVEAALRAADPAVQITETGN